MKTDLAGLELKPLEDFVVSLGHKKFHAKQIYEWIWKRGVTEFGEMTNLSVELRSSLAEQATVSLPRVIHHDISKDGTQKFVLQLAHTLLAAPKHLHRGNPRLVRERMKQACRLGGIGAARDQGGRHADNRINIC